jgi:hypothetical protein
MPLLNKRAFVTAAFACRYCLPSGFYLASTSFRKHIQAYGSGFHGNTALFSRLIGIFRTLSAQPLTLMSASPCLCIPWQCRYGLRAMPSLLSTNRDKLARQSIITLASFQATMRSQQLSTQNAGIDTAFAKQTITVMMNARLTTGSGYGRAYSDRHTGPTSRSQRCAALHIQAPSREPCSEAMVRQRAHRRGCANCRFVCGGDNYT